jgi:hypothetical protein
MVIIQLVQEEFKRKKLFIRASCQSLLKKTSCPSISRLHPPRLMIRRSPPVTDRSQNVDAPPQLTVKTRCDYLFRRSALAGRQRKGRTARNSSDSRREGASEARRSHLDTLLGRKDGLWTKPESIAEAPMEPNDVRLQESNDHHGNWLDCIRQRRLCIADVEIGARSATICHLGNLAYESREELTWDPVRERFVGNEEANKSLSRPMRSPWHL